MVLGEKHGTNYLPCTWYPSRCLFIVFLQNLSFSDILSNSVRIMLTVPVSTVVIFYKSFIKFSLCFASFYILFWVPDPKCNPCFEYLTPSGYFVISYFFGVHNLLLWSVKSPVFLNIKALSTSRSFLLITGRQFSFSN